jgi:predicted RNase H-like HicB family nuclease
MKNTHTSTLVLALSVLFAGHAMADQANVPVVGKTREQVRAELIEYKAAHHNDVYLPFSNTLISDLVKDMDAINAQRGAATADSADKAPLVGKTREEVRAELMEYKAAHRNDVYLPFSNTLVSDLAKDMDAIKSQRDVPATANADKMQSKTDAVKG